MMIRPRGGDFCYAPGEIEAMREDIRVARGEGADGVVFGCLGEDGDIDEAIAAALLEEASGLAATFHRAFDASRDLAGSLEALIRLGFSRVLTSGGAASAPAGLDTLAALTAQSGGRIVVMPGGGITADRVAEVARYTGARECHLSARESRASPMRYRRDGLPMGASAVPREFERKVASEALIRLARGTSGPRRKTGHAG